MYDSWIPIKRERSEALSEGSLGRGIRVPSVNSNIGLRKSEGLARISYTARLIFERDAAQITKAPPKEGGYAYCLSECRWLASSVCWALLEKGIPVP